MIANRTGTVYILENKSFPGLIKIGRSKSLTNRISTLSNNTCLPYPFTCTYWRDVMNCNAVEQALHACLAEYRIRWDREFFNIRPEWAREALDAVISLGAPESEDVNPSCNDNYDYPLNYSTTQKSTFAFHKSGIPLGASIYFLNSNNHSAFVVGDKLVQFKKKVVTLDSATFKVANQSTKRNIERLNTARLWTYKGRPLIHYKPIRNCLNTNLFPAFP